MWSCSSTPGPGLPEGGGGASAGNGGALAGMGGRSTELGGASGNQQAGGGQGGSTAGVSGSLGGGSSESGAGGDSAGGSVGEAGANDGGAAGSADSTPFDGECGQGWAAGGAASRPNLKGSVTPQVDKSGNWTFSFGRYRLVVAGSHGARVIEFSIDGQNLIDATGGSTFWPSPQQNYTWPPPAEIDTAAYTAQADATSLSLTSATASVTSSTLSGLRLSVLKRFWVNADSGVISIEYQLTNQSKTASASWAPWEVTRVRAGGYTFAPKGPGTRTITQDSFQNPLALSVLPPAPAAGGIAWLDYPSLSATLTQDNYINEFDGAEGWLAHANRFGTSLLPVLFVKSFVDAPDASLPSNQAEIQLWTSGTAKPKLIEVEEQGALQVLMPGESLTWTVHWAACELPNATLLSAGNLELATFARALAIKP